MSPSFLPGLGETITVPASLAYPEPSEIFTVGLPIVGITPTEAGGAITSYAISPPLPSGITLDPATGTLSGTPTAVSPTSNYTITASNSLGSATTTISITVNDLAPNTLTYSTNPAVYTMGTAIPNDLPSNQGGTIASYGVTPSLPTGLALNTATGVISGSPTAITPSANYVVTGTNTGGSTTATVSITVNAVAPSSLVYATNPATYVKGTAIPNDAPTNSGGAITGYSVSPALPAGLALSPLTGVISGTPTAVAATSTYVVTGTNSGGNATANVSITVNDVAPSSLTYSTNPAVYTKGSAITNNTPSNSGGTVVSYSVNPALPAGLSISPATGVISGTPTAVTALSTYVVTAMNSGGSTAASLSITVNDIPPSSLAYSSQSPTYTQASAIAGNTPSSSGGAVVTYSSSNLPTGLVLNPSTGAISGTPKYGQAATNCTITATNSGGSTSDTLSITVNTIAPVLNTVSNQEFSSGALKVGTATSVDFYNTVTGDDVGMSYTCVYDQVVNGAVSPGTACTSLPGSVATFSATTGTLNWTPNSSAWGSFELKVTGTNSAGSSSQIFVISVFQGYPTANLVIDLDGDFVNQVSPGVNSPLSTTWDNIYTTGTGYSGTLSNFPATGTTSDGWAGSGTQVSPYGLVFNASGTRVNLGSAINNNSLMMVSTWVSAANISGTKTGTVIATNNDNGSGVGFTLRQSLVKAGQVELETIANATHTYSQEVLSIGAPSLYGYWRLNESSGTTLTDSSGNGNNGNYYVGSTLTSATRGVTGALVGDSTSSAVSFASTGTASNATLFSSSNGPQTYSEEIWFKTASGYSSGGVIMNYGSSRNGASGSYDRKIWMSNTGTISTGVYNSGTCVITSPNAYNDGNWHQVVATYTAGSLILYMDGAQVAIATTAAPGSTCTAAEIAAAQKFQGYWRIGYDSSGGWSPVPTSASFPGTLDEASAYSVVLTPAQVLSHYQVGSRKCQSTTALANNAITSLTGVFDGQYSTLYVNGSSVCSVNYGAGSTLDPGEANLTLGATSSGANSWAGSLFDFKAYTSGTPTDVTNLYNATSPRF